MKKYFVKQFIILAIAIIACISLLAGIGMAWFTNQYRLASIAKIHPLTYISILDPGDSAIRSIDLSYDKSEVHDGQVTIKRPFVIRSNGEYFDLCIAHTTNISGLNIKLYEALDNGVQGNAYLAGITDKGLPYYWNKKTEDDILLNGEYKQYINKKNGDVVAVEGDSAFNETFRLANDTVYSNVQKNARPLYRIIDNYQGSKRADDDEYWYANFILELSWLETDKETDILYVIAQTSDTAEVTP